MKVLMLGWELPPHFVGGMGVVCYSLCEHLAKSGADIEFLLPFEADYSDIKFMSVNPKHTQTKETKKITYKHLDAVNATAYGRADISTEEAIEMKIMPLDVINDTFMQKITASCMAAEYDIIHAHDWLTLRGAMLAKQLTGLPMVVHIHATEFDRSGAADGERGNEMIHQIEYEGMMMADRILAVSQLTKDVIIKRYGIPADKIDVVHNSIDLNSPHLVEETTQVNQIVYFRAMKAAGYKIVLNAGRQSIQKGLPGLLRAAQLTLSYNPKILFVFVGSGDMHQELVDTAAALGISRNVVFTGFLKGKNLRDLFSAADLFVMPSVSEPFGSTPLEALGLKTPVLISKQSGVNEILSNALKVDFWDIDQMADQILCAVENPSMLSELAENGYKEFLSQSWMHPANKTLHSYHRASRTETAHV